jgi:hypothetical protein
MFLKTKAFLEAIKVKQHNPPHKIKEIQTLTLQPLVIHQIQHHHYKISHPKIVLNK